MDAWPSFKKGTDLSFLKTGLTKRTFMPKITGRCGRILRLTSDSVMSTSARRARLPIESTTALKQTKIIGSHAWALHGLLSLSMESSTDCSATQANPQFVADTGFTTAGSFSQYSRNQERRCDSIRQTRSSTIGRVCQPETSH